MEHRGEINAQDNATTPAAIVSTYDPSAQLFSKPSLSYIALIAKVILSSPSQKLNLASIYGAMEEQFPYLKSRGPGWRNSVRHNLSVNECFVKVSRCEDGRGHYWGVHQAHLRDFQQGNFRQCRKARGRREREQCDEVAECLAWMETRCLLGGRYQSRSLGCVELQCPLQELREYQLSSSDWTQPQNQQWRINVGWVHSPSWTRQCCFPHSLPHSCVWATAGRGHESQPMSSRLNCWETNDPVFTGMQGSYDSRFMTPPGRACRFSGCWCAPPVIKELEKPLPHRVNFYCL